MDNNKTKKILFLIAFGVILFVGLNQKNYLIPRGVSVELPLPVWEIVQMALRAEAQVDADLRLG